MSVGSGHLEQLLLVARFFHPSYRPRIEKKEREPKRVEIDWGKLGRGGGIYFFRSTISFKVLFVVTTIARS